MPSTTSIARDQMCSALKTVVDARNSPLEEPQKLVLLWDDDANGVPPELPAPWARVLVKHNPNVGGQSSLSGGLPKIRYTRKGIIAVQLFTPAGDGNVVADELTPIILSAYEGKTTSGGLIFRHGRFTEVGKDGDWSQRNLTVEFEYDEFR